MFVKYLMLVQNLKGLLCFIASLCGTLLKRLIGPWPFFRMPKIKDIEKVKESANEKKLILQLALLPLAFLFGCNLC